MSNAGGFITLHRQIIEWEWYKDSNTKCLFIHLLLMANFTDGRFEGKEVKRGQLITSLPSLAKQTSLSIQQVRTALAKLKSTGEITDTSTRHYRVITICKYNEYQDDNRQNNRQPTDNQQTDNRQPTDNQQTDNRQPTDNQQQYNNDNNDNKETMKQNNSPTESKTKERNNKSSNTPAKKFVKPTREEIRRYCMVVRRNDVDWDKFYDFYESNGWKVGKSTMKDWKAAVRYWERERKGG